MRDWSLAKVWGLFLAGGLLDLTVSEYTEAFTLVKEFLASVSFLFAIIYTVYKINHLRQAKNEPKP